MDFQVKYRESNQQCSKSVEDLTNTRTLRVQEVFKPNLVRRGNTLKAINPTHKSAIPPLIFNHMDLYDNKHPLLQVTLSEEQV